MLYKYSPRKKFQREELSLTLERVYRFSWQQNVLDVDCFALTFEGVTLFFFFTAVTFKICMWAMKTKDVI